MADTVETLRADLDALRLEFDEFKARALPVVVGHEPPPPSAIQLTAYPPGMTKEPPS